MILEKQWAKIHSNYMVTEGGWFPEVWKALTAAPTGNIAHSRTTYDQLF